MTFPPHRIIVTDPTARELVAALCGGYVGMLRTDAEGIRSVTPSSEAEAAPAQDARGIQLNLVEDRPDIHA
jgi:hypothetical protein